MFRTFIFFQKKIIDKYCRHTRSLFVLQFLIIVLAMIGSNEANYSKAMVNFQNNMLVIPWFIHIIIIIF